MKRLILLSLMMALLCSCGNNLRPLKVEYEIIPVENYVMDVEKSKIPSQYSSYQLLEITSMVKSVKYKCLFNKIVLLDVNRQSLNTNDLFSKFPEYKDVSFICKDEIEQEGFSLNGEITDLQILEQLKSNKSVLMYDGITYIPITDEVKALAETAKYKAEFIKSLKELCEYL